MGVDAVGSTTSTRWLAKYLVWANPSRWVRATRCCSAARFSVHAMWSPRRSNAVVITTACSAVIAPAAHAVRVHPHRGRSPSASGAVAVAYRIAAGSLSGGGLGADLQPLRQRRHPLMGGQIPAAHLGHHPTGQLIQTGPHPTQHPDQIRDLVVGQLPRTRVDPLG